MRRDETASEVPIYDHEIGYPGDLGCPFEHRDRLAEKGRYEAEAGIRPEQSHRPLFPSRRWHDQFGIRATNAI